MLLSSEARADALEILGPRGDAPPEGFVIAVVRRSDEGRAVVPAKASVTVNSGSVRSAPPAPPLLTFLIVPESDARSVRVEVKDGALRAERTFTLGPPAAKVTLELVGERPVKGRDRRVQFDVKLLRADGTPDPDSPRPVLRSNVGSIESVEPAGPGHFRATYVLPSTRFPEVAVIVAFAPWPHPDSIHGSLGTLLVPLASAIDLSGRTERNADMSLEIAGITYGPRKAGPDGRFTIPVVVPPGHRFARGTAIDRAGNKRVTKIDLLLPPVDQLACVVNPRKLPADGVSRARVICATSDVYGAPQKSANLELRATAGERGQRRSLGEGLYEWIITAPAQLSAKPVELSAQWKEGRNVSKEELQIELVQGPAAKLSLTAQDDLVHYGGALKLAATVKDALDRPRDGVTVEVKAPLGEVGPVVPDASEKGSFGATWTAPALGTGSTATLRARAFGPPGTEPARILAWREGGELFAGVTDLAGWPVPNQALELGTRRIQTREDGSIALGALSPGVHELSHAQWPGLTLTLHVLDEALAWPLSRRSGTDDERLEVLLAPPLPVNIRVEIEGRTVTYWAEDPRGQLLTDRGLVVDLQGGEATGTSTKAGRTSFTVTGKGRAQVSVADPQTGVTALAEVAP